MMTTWLGRERKTNKTASVLYLIYRCLRCCMCSNCSWTWNTVEPQLSEYCKYYRHCIKNCRTPDNCWWMHRWAAVNVKYVLANLQLLCVIRYLMELWKCEWKLKWIFLFAELLNSCLDFKCLHYSKDCF